MNYHKFQQVLIWKIWIVLVTFMLTLTFHFVSSVYDPFAETKEILAASTGAFAKDIITSNATDENGNVISTIMTLHGVTLCTIGYNTKGIPTTMIVFKDEVIQSSGAYNATTHTSNVIHFDETGTAKTKYVEFYNPLKNRAVRENYNESDVVNERNVLFFDENGAVTRSMPASTGAIVLPALAYNIFNEVLQVLEMAIAPAEAAGFVKRVPLKVNPDDIVHSVLTVLIGVRVYVTTFTNEGNIPVALTLMKFDKLHGEMKYDPVTFDSNLITFGEDQQVKLIYNTSYDADLRLSEMMITNDTGDVINKLSKSFDLNGNLIA